MAKTLGPVRRACPERSDGLPLIEFRNVVKRFGDFTAVDDVSPASTSASSRRSAPRAAARDSDAGCRRLEHPSEGDPVGRGEPRRQAAPTSGSVNMMFQSLRSSRT